MIKIKLLEALQDGPGSAYDIAPSVGIDSRRTAVRLRLLWQEGVCDRKPFYRDGPARRKVWMYGLKGTMT